MINDHDHHADGAYRHCYHQGHFPSDPRRVILTRRHFVARVELGFQIPIAKILFAALDDKGRVSRVARHAEDERLGLRRRQLFIHAPLSVCGHIVLQAGAGEAIAISFARVIGLRANIAVTLQSVHKA